MQRFSKKYNPMSSIGRDIKDAELKIELESGLEIHLWDIIQLEIELHMDKYSTKVAAQKRKNTLLKRSSGWEAKKISKHDNQGITIG